LDNYGKISKLILYIPNATVNQYAFLLDRLAIIRKLKYIGLKLDTSSQFFNCNSINGATSIMAMIKQFKEKLPSLKDLFLIFREKDFTLISEKMKRQYFEKMARTARFSL
jgi:DNA-binding transcriptional MerR regulator